MADDKKEELQNVQRIAANENAYAAIRVDGSVGSVVTFGSREDGGDSREVQDRLKNVKEITPAGAGAFAALLADGQVVTWGNKRCGADSSQVPEQVKGVQDPIHSAGLCRPG